MKAFLNPIIYTINNVSYVDDIMDKKPENNIEAVDFKEWSSYTHESDRKKYLAIDKRAKATREDIWLLSKRPRNKANT